MPHVPFHFFLIIFLALTFGAQILMYRITSRFLIGKKVKKSLVNIYLPILFVLVNIPFFWIRLDAHFFHESFARTFIMVPFYAYQTLSLAALVATLLVLVVRAPFRFKRHMERSGTQENVSYTSESRRAFLRKGAIGLGAYTFLGSLHSIYDREDYKIDHVTLSIKNLPASLDGLTVSMISDIHSGIYMLEDDMLKYREAVNNLKADMIFIPGDFVTSDNNEVLPVAKAFSGLKSKYGTYTCLGNHDFFANPDYITAKLRDVGMKVLRNETEELEINGAKLVISGVDDGRHANFPKVSYEASSFNAARILLCHKPYFFESAVAGQFDLMLSGHTHGGQIVLLDLFGAKVTPAALISPYISGQYRLGDALMYVSRGIGTVGLPIRVNCPPEITLFTIRRKDS